jgi:hypothetical protein
MQRRPNVTVLRGLDTTLPSQEQCRVAKLI